MPVQEVDTKNSVLSDKKSLNPPLVIPEAGKMPDLEGLRDSAQRSKHAVKIDSPPFVLAPDIRAVPSNLNIENPIAFVNGMNMSAESIRNAGQQIANLRGQHVYVIPNDSNGFVEDLRNCTLSALHRKLGERYESTAVNNTLEFLRDKISKGAAPIEIYAYSQGNLILDNAIYLLESEILGRDYNKLPVEDRVARHEEWQNLCSSIRIYRYGAPINSVPEKMLSVEMRHSTDPVAKISVVLTPVTDAWDMTHGKERGKSVVITIPSPKKNGESEATLISHDFAEYMKNNAAFFVAAMNNFTPQEKSHALISSIRNGAFSDMEHERILFQMLKENNGGFSVEQKVLAVQLMQDIPQRTVGSFYFSDASARHIFRVSTEPAIEPKKRPNHDAHIFRKVPNTGHN